MSVPVELAALRAQIARYGPDAFLVTTATDAPPHVSSVRVEATDEEITMGCGRQTGVNAIAHPAVSLLWPPGPDAGYCLIVDAVVQGTPGRTLTVQPTSAVMHRVAGADPKLPRCLPLDTGTEAPA
jgi:hypothetical protein